MADEWAAAMQEQVATDEGEVDVDDVLAQAEAEANPMGLDELKNEGAPRELGPELDLILDIPVSISMEVGSTSITIRNLLQLNQGSVIELDRLAGEPLDVKVNGTLIAHGEVVVVNEKFGIRMTDVISPSERIKKLR
ncbi:flagellar motor switch protein FliN [Gilvimarinus sp. SDUM040013]|uniref:Flagellar motor switch protein FliN n=1 Tax=Gilvimarinus gilvus TaxID=3058038 RepID=A0ABU4RW60_9GAMM|nr:flagellar motor switch protein FliN [Gilvimarinus sp. SDUM040013]MDO3385051.1 flagellar motor switch protein FliN [Gilvimarinus sp. SDUM040013]MDX6848426.1 flagellar motor switch protein FliN [Gilvimarinus sp. SDUM040013]